MGNPMHAQPPRLAPLPAGRDRDRALRAGRSASGTSLRMSVTKTADDVAIAATGDLDLGAADAFERDVRRHGADCRRLVVDLRGVDFLDSGGLRTLLALRNDAKRRGHELVLVPGPAGVQRVFALSGTRGLFDWREESG
jgi:anti-anti-sigma factor